MDRVLVVGLGSMGRRRIRLMTQIDPSLAVAGVDFEPSRRSQTMEQFGIACYESIDAAMKAFKPEAGFVCTSPLSHRTVITELLNHGLHVFTEINLILDGYDEMVRLARDKGRVLFLSSTFLYRNDVRYLIGQCREHGPLDYIVHTGQYLPDWHPWESYKNFFVGNIRTNGIREILAIDMPWILSAFGPVSDIHVRRSKNSSLDLNYEDNYIISMAHENGNKGVFVCDLLSRRGGRSAEVFSENMYLTWQGTPDSLMRFDLSTGHMAPVETYSEAIDHQAAYASNIIENAYAEEIRTFFREIEGERAARYGFEDDRYTLEIINRIEGRE